MSDTTVHSLRVRVANPPLTVPHATAGGMVASFPMVLLDLRTRGGLVGSAYVFTYTMVAAPSVARLVRELEPLLVGQPAAPRALAALLRQRFRLLGPQGFTMMAAAAIDMAAWDVTCKAAGLPLHQMLGGVARGSRGYAPVGLAGEAGAVREALAGTASSAVPRRIASGTSSAWL
jgi:mandelate racemase